MTILLSVTGFQPTDWINALHRLAPRRPVILEPNSGSDPSVDYAIVWKQRPGILAGLPNLKAIFSIGAGVDHILRDTHLPDVPIVRIVADDLTGRMSEYVVWRVLDHFRRGMAYRTQQAAGIWHDRVQPAARELTVGIMGLGELGRDAAEKLGMLGFRIVGWSRTQKTIAGVDSFHGASGLDPFLARTDILVVLLPITPETHGILDTGLFSRLKQRTPIGGPVLINAGRGGLQVETAILKALDDETLMEASLDVFETEPLPASSRLWKHPRVFVTPHAAATSNADALVPQILSQIDAFERGEPLQHLVDRKAGY
ncbi:glyoxylate/hydroxypyruvate reductase A [Aureimonas sp. SA4125]|uniref:2-hydroxyacid dehydrogenase n=1 Tax=Aureimonas sp. SA4125 TaxID=2826993 RepID=UPI001CC69C9B|nr:glyoxylate/hydroxypyruvate reductase A [Aureimonas sp. SA4125]BDA82660.1 glyoxylate/hydroxypyruvate reductase A [Aureimonas sp. SA4125]